MTRLSKRGFVEGRPKLYDSVEKMEFMIEDYFNMCDAQKEIIRNDKGHTKIIHKPYTITGLCLHLNIADTTTLTDYQNDPVFSSTVKKAKKRCENWVEEKSLTGEINPTAAIFNLKNNYGWKDKSEVETVDKTKESYEEWLQENNKALKNVTPEIKEIEK